MLAKQQHLVYNRVMCINAYRTVGTQTRLNSEGKLYLLFLYSHETHFHTRIFIMAYGIKYTLNKCTLIALNPNIFFALMYFSGEDGGGA